jgi:hypothetical protein
VPSRNLPLCKLGCYVAMKSLGGSTTACLGQFSEADLEHFSRAPKPHSSEYALKRPRIQRKTGILSSEILPGLSVTCLRVVLHVLGMVRVKHSGARRYPC